MGVRGVARGGYAEYGEHEIRVNINSLAILGGRLPARALGMVTEWASLHQRGMLDRGTPRLL